LSQVTDDNSTRASTGSFFTTNATSYFSLGSLPQVLPAFPTRRTSDPTPAGLAVSFDNAPHTNAGTYQVTATVTDANYSGSATGSDRKNTGTASIQVASLCEVFRGSSLTPRPVPPRPEFAVSFDDVLHP